MWELDSKEGWVQKNYAFELWCWRRPLRVLWTARRSNQSILKEISPEYFIGRTDVKAETPILWPPDAKNYLLEKTLILGKVEGRREGADRGWDGWMTSSTQWALSLNKLREIVKAGKPGMLQSMGLQRVGHDWATEQQQNQMTEVGKELPEKVKND